MKVTSFSLENGATCFLAPKKETSLVQILVGYRVGSNNEQDGERGLAHFYEHMCFKGTKKYPTPKKLIESISILGGSVNAFTANGITAYYILVPKKHAKKALAIIADMAMHPLFPEKEIEKEKGVILSEIQMYEDDPRSISYDSIKAQLYGGTPAAYPVLGLKKDVLAVTRDSFVDFFNTHYGASNTVIVVSGNFDTKNMKQEVSDLFSPMQKGKRTPMPKIQATRKGERIVVIPKKTEQCAISIAFPSFTPSLSKTQTIDALGHVLGAGLSGRLPQKIREEMGACYAIGASNVKPPRTSYAFLECSVGIDVSRVEEVARAIVAEFSLLKKERINDIEFKTIMNKTSRSISTISESASGLGRYIFFNHVMFGKIRSEKEWMQELKKITPANIQKAAQDILVTKDMRINVVGPVKNKRKLETFLKTLKV